MDAAAIEEQNKLRVSMGMKPLPVPTAAKLQPNGTDSDASCSDSDEDVGSTLEKREAQAYENYRKMQEAEELKKQREQKSAAIKKARDKALRNAVLQGKGLADLEEDEVDTKAWLKGQKKRQKKVEAERQAEEKKAADEAAAAAAREYTSKDLAGVRVAHDVNDFLDGSDQVLTLKDTGVLDDEDDGVELENADMRDQEKLKERLQLKKKKPLYDPNDVDETGERSILAQYDEEISGKVKKSYTLNADGILADLDHLSKTASSGRQVASLDMNQPVVGRASDYLDISEIKIKKAKKKKSTKTRQHALDDEDALFPAIDENADTGDTGMDVDAVSASLPKKRKLADDGFVDDDDLQHSLALQRRDALKKRKRARPEDIAKQLREESAVDSEDGQGGSGLREGGGLMLDETSGFLDNLHKSNESEVRRPVRKDKTPVTAEEPDEDEEMEDSAAVKDELYQRDLSAEEDFTGNGVEEEKTIGAGMGSAVQLLRERNLLGGGSGATLNEDYRSKQQFLAEKERRMAIIAEETRARRERDRASGRMDRMGAKEREEWQRQQNLIQDQQTSRMMMGLFDQQYRPNIDIRYTDDYGRNLNQKEAFKEMSHQFHGKGSGKGKTDKRLKKIEDEKRREAQSMLDASQNVGMSSATAQQLKKRHEAGVRLA
jgi:U4/U6.U5 tri-snRNP-associated protein 1